MHAVRRVRENDHHVSWTVVDGRGVPVAAVDDFLAYLDAIERSPNTVRAYAYDLKTYLDFLAGLGKAFEDVTAEDLGYFVQFLRRPHENIPLLTPAAALRQPTTVNRALAAVSAFYRYCGRRDGSDIATRLSIPIRRSPGGDRDLLAGIARPREPQPVIGPRLKVQRHHLSTLTIQQARTIIDACTSLRDRLFFSLLLSSGIRRGQALGLRHCDLDTRRQALTIVPRGDNTNGARAKSRNVVTIPLPRDLCRLYLEYMHQEYGWVDSDYVFINLTGQNKGAPLAEATVDKLVNRLREKTGIHGWSCHTFRHTWATLHYRAGMPLEVISHLLTHSSLATTADIYTHLDVGDLRQQLITYGCWEAP